MLHKGGIDPHTHLTMEFMGTETIDGFFSDQVAPLAGGTTMHIDFVISVHGSLNAGLEAYENKAKKSCMDYGIHMATTKWDEVVSEEMEVMVKEEGVNSFKFFMAYKGSFMINDELLLEGLKRCKVTCCLGYGPCRKWRCCILRTETNDRTWYYRSQGHALSRPPLLEGEATARAIHLAKFVNTPLYVHVISIYAMEEIAKGQKGRGSLESP